MELVWSWRSCHVLRVFCTRDDVLAAGYAWPEAQKMKCMFITADPVCKINQNFLTCTLFLLGCDARQGASMKSLHFSACLQTKHLKHSRTICIYGPETVLAVCLFTTLHQQDSVQRKIEDKPTLKISAVMNDRSSEHLVSKAVWNAHPV